MIINSMKGALQKYQKKCMKVGVTPTRVESYQFIHLQQKCLGPKGIDALTVLLKYCSEAIELDVGGNYMCDEGAIRLSKVIAKMTKLEHLDISNNSLSSDGICLIMKSIHNCKRLNYLNLSGNLVNNVAIDKIGDVIDISYVKHLHLSYDQITDELIENIKPYIAVNVHLQTLDLSWNHIRKDGIASLMEALQSNQSITDLDLSWNGIGQDGCKSVAEMLENNKTLKTLNVSGNRINMQGIKSLLNGLENNIYLQSLLVHSNPVTASGISATVRRLLTRSTLNRIDLGDMHIEAGVAKNISNLNNKIVRHGAVVNGVVSLPPIKENKKIKIRNEFGIEEYSDPMTPMWEYLKRTNIRVIDLYNGFERKQECVTKQDIKRAFKKYLKTKIDNHTARLILKSLDLDETGQVTIHDLILSQRRYTRKMRQQKLLEAQKKKEKKASKKEKLKHVIINRSESLNQLPVF